MTLFEHHKTFAPKGIPASFIMLTPEINIVEQTSKLLDDMNDGDIAGAILINILNSGLTGQPIHWF